MRITFIQTGGTIDKVYPIKVGSYAFEIKEPAVKKILKTVRPNFSFKIISILKKDSLEITHFERERIYEACKKDKSERIIITHGTDTIIETAAILSRLKDKVIILTGSHLPESFKESDAMFNIGTAIGAMNILQKGVYIAMNGRVYSWNECRKDEKTAIFIEN